MMLYVPPPPEIKGNYVIFLHASFGSALMSEGPRHLGGVPGKISKGPWWHVLEVCYNLQQIQNLVRGPAELGSLSLSLLGCFVITTACGWKPLFNNTSSLSVLEML